MFKLVFKDLVSILIFLTMFLCTKWLVSARTNQVCFEDSFSCVNIFSSVMLKMNIFSSCPQLKAEAVEL